MAWYYILFFIVFGYFIIKTILSWFLGDIDIDFDTDGDVDFDVSSLLSFKGVVHFLLGFSGCLSALARFSFNETTTFTSWQYLLAFVVGVAFMFILWYVYKAMSKLSHTPNEPQILGKKCIVTLNRGNGHYVVGVQTPQGTFTREVISTDNNIPLGTEKMIRWNEVEEAYEI